MQTLSPRALTIGTMAMVVVILLQGCAAAIVGGAAVGVAMIHDRRTTGTIVEDQTIELKGREAFLSSDELRKQSHINITSYNNVVLLTGEAPSEVLRQRAEALVRRIPEIKRIHNEIKIAAPSALISRSSDAILTGKVKTQLLGLKIKNFDPTRVKVVTEDGTVYLLGLLRRTEAGAAVDQARRVGGVQRVVKVFEYLD